MGEVAANDRATALVVDLDGTLAKTDVLIESVIRLLGRKPWLAFPMIGWLLRGKAEFKRRIAERIEVDAARLPYHADVVRLAEEARAQGRRVVLATAAAERHAQAVASHLGLFDEVISSSNSVNLSGAKKAELLVQRFGERGFDYAGNAYADLRIWRVARQAILVNPAPGLKAGVRRGATLDQVLEDRRSFLASVVRQLRVHQWAKNLLVFLPAIAAHAVGDWQVLARCLLAFIAFSAVASAVYVMNDLLDLQHDRQHPRKRFRPFAAGDLPLQMGVGLAPALLIAGLAIGFAVSPLFALVLMVYLVTTIAYSLFLRGIAILDVMVLASLYTIRMLGGSAVIEQRPSFWLLAFSTFLFLSLAMVKRYIELRHVVSEGQHGAAGRGYRAGDTGIVAALGSATGLMSVLILALYIDSPKVAELYRVPEALWLVCLVLLFWIARVWLLAHRDEMHDDPVVFALKDPVSIALGVIGLGVVAYAALA
jgi:4-hydroxybenzoate polyprenyltransferase